MLSNSTANSKAHASSTAVITTQLLRKRAEHNNGDLGSLEEITLHQFNIEAINGCLQTHCKRLKILLLQSNQICRIENLSKLKDLKYLNLALNNIQVVENLQGCECLHKLDLTCNFIATLGSLHSLAANEQLRELYLVGNPCTQLENYRLIVARILPQLTILDSRQFTSSERILAARLPASSIPCYNAVDPSTLILPSNVDIKDVDPLEVTSHDPVSRIQAARSLEARRHPAPSPSILSAATDASLKEKMDPMPRFNKDTGKIMQRNHLDVAYSLVENEEFKTLRLTVEFAKSLDSSLIDVDVREEWVSVVVKGRALQLALPFRINANRVDCLRSGVTGHLAVDMHKLDTSPIEPVTLKSFTGYEIKSKAERAAEQIETASKQTIPAANPVVIRSVRTQRELPADFIDDPDVPPLM
eukprot:Partr_v1_DN26429_c0_g1_i2_m23521 putative leucine rich repeat containing 6